MKIESPFFDLPELVCEDVFNTYGEFAWNFFDPRLIIFINSLRDRLGRPIYVNDWEVHGKYSQRGLRCLKCDIVQDKIMSNANYISAHCTGKAVDFEVPGQLAEETRTWIKEHQNWWPYNFRMEKDVNWVHIDLYNNTSFKIVEFNK